MTEQVDLAPGRTAPVIPPVIEPKPDSRLEQLVAMYEQAKDEAAAADQRLKMLKDSIKAELVMAAPGSNRILLHSDYLSSPYRLVARSQRRCDTKSLKSVEPAIWERFAYDSTSWYFEVDK